MSAEQNLKDGDIAAALTSLKQLIRSDAANAKYRVFLFQILAVTGDLAEGLGSVKRRWGTGRKCVADGANVPRNNRMRRTSQRDLRGCSIAVDYG